MPLILITGYPCSGKTTRCRQIQQYFEEAWNKKVHVISEEKFYQQSNTNRNALVFDAKKQKEVRGILKNNVTRLLGSDIVILDASNSNKGFRYELYCATKCHKTNQCILECAISEEKAWLLNEAREGNDKYTREAFEALIALFEPVNSSNRWDSPLITVQLDDSLPGSDIYNLLFERNTPKPNQSTQNVPLCSSTYLSDLDKVTKDVVNSILLLKNDGVSGRNIKLSNVDAELTVLDDRITARKLANLKRQFISYCKLNPPTNSQNNIAKLFIQFVNSSS